MVVAENDRDKKHRHKPINRNKLGIFENKRGTSVGRRVLHYPPEPAA